LSIMNLRPEYLKEGAEEAERQRAAIERLKTRRETDENCTQTYFIQTMGCQMNARDSEKLKGILETIGCREVPENEADLVIYNTCCVRENAESRVYGRLGYLKSLKKRNPRLKIALCGCMMQEKTVIEKLQKSYPEVDLVFGTYNLYRFPELMEAMLDSDRPIFDLWQEQKEIVEDLPSVRKYPFKASVNIMYGCDNFCTYCIVPYVRGRERSREPENILAEVRALAESGVKEIQLLGQNVNSYGKGLENPITFAELLEQVANIDGIERVRFMSSHPKDLSDELIEVMGRVPKICPHFHLPLQSGSSRLLKKMNRRYDQERFLSLVHKFKAAVPEIALTTDIIVGFPGETREDFEETLKVVKEARFDSAFTFIYSPRVGTPAALMEQVPEEESKVNFEELLKVIEDIAYENHQQWVGREVEVLAEDVSKNDEHLLTGRTPQNILVHFPAGKRWIGETAKVRIKEASAFYMLGEMVGNQGE